jgi:hypothetical protein
MTFCLLALFLGAFVATWAGVGQFAVGLLAVVVGGTILALGCGAGFGTTLSWAFALFVCAEIGYGLGLGAIALLRARRSTSAVPGFAERVSLPFLHRPFWK